MTYASDRIVIRAVSQLKSFGRLAKVTYGLAGRRRVARVLNERNLESGTTSVGC